MIILAFTQNELFNLSDHKLNKVEQWHWHLSSFNSTVAEMDRPRITKVGVLIATGSVVAHMQMFKNGLKVKVTYICIWVYTHIYRYLYNICSVGTIYDEYKF